MLTDYTTASEVRAVLGVAKQELTDAVIGLPIYDQLFSFDLSDLSATISDDFLALPENAEDRSKPQQLFFDCMRVFAAYAVAMQLIGQEPMFAPVKIIDSKTSLERPSNPDPYESTRLAVESGYNTMRKRLLAAYSALVPTAVVATPVAKLIGFSGVGLGTDPVLGV